MKYFRVKSGYGKDEFISIDETELSTALRAQITGKVGVFKDGTISGNHIISITPDFNRVMGFNRGYELTSEDWVLIGTKQVSEYREYLETARLALEGKVPQPTKVLSEGVKQLASKMTQPTWDQ